MDIFNGIISTESFGLSGATVNTVISGGTVSIENFPTNQDVTITNTPSVDTGLLQPITNSELRANPIAVSGTVTVSSIAISGTSSVTVTNFPNVQAISGNTTVTNLPFDAAGRIRMSQVTNLGDYKVLNGVFNTLLMEQVGTGTFTTNTNNVNMSVTSGQYAIIRSKMMHPYFNGKSQLIQLTAFNMGAATNVTKSIGYHSSDATAPYTGSTDGFRLIKDTSNNYSIQVLNNGTTLFDLPRTQWYDKLDGTGPSGMNIDWDKFNVFTFDFLWLGGTTLKCYVHYNGQNILFAK